MPWVLLGLSIAACEGLPRWSRTLPARMDLLVQRAALAVLAPSLLVSLSGELGHRFATQQITDPVTGLGYSRADLTFELKRRLMAFVVQVLFGSSR